MKIALLGYGKMGKTIASLATDAGHEIVLTTSNAGQITSFNNANVAIDFSVPSAAVANIKLAIDHNIPVISGTTGWLDNYDSVVDYCNANQGAMLYASNFSVGVNLFFALNKSLAKLMEDHPEYEPSITEIHHTQKLDAPSGTAITLANQILKYSQKKQWALHNKNNKDLCIDAKREGDIKGTHYVQYKSAVDTITISHEAHSREGFALGALLAANWIQGKQGIFGMNNVLGIN